MEPRLQFLRAEDLLNPIKLSEFRSLAWKIGRRDPPSGGDCPDDDANGCQRANLDVIVSLLDDEKIRYLKLSNSVEPLKITGFHYIPFRSLTAAYRRH